MTDNHNYETPSGGSGSWDVPLNNNFNAIDTDMPVWDLDANTGNYTASNGAIFIATDNGNVYQGDGTSWNLLYSIGGGENLTSSEIRQAAYRDGPTVTVETTSAKSASQTGSDPTYGETSVSLPDGWTFELIEAGAWDESSSGTSTAEILRTAEGDVTDETTYTSVHTTNDTNAVPTDGGGNIDFTQTLYSYTNNTGGPVRFFFRAINSDSVSSEYAVGGNWTFVRRAP